MNTLNSCAGIFHVAICLAIYGLLVASSNGSIHQGALIQVQFQRDRNRPERPARFYPGDLDNQLVDF
jgi:hypothetical protein